MYESNLRMYTACTVPMKSEGKMSPVWFPSCTIPEAVNAEGPMEMKIPGRWESRGSFCVMRRYRNAAHTMKLMRYPVPCTVTEAMATATVLSDASCPDLLAPAIRLLPKGAVRRRG